MVYGKLLGIVEHMLTPDQAVCTILSVSFSSLAFGACHTPKTTLFAVGLGPPPRQLEKKKKKKPKKNKNLSRRGGRRRRRISRRA